MTLQTCDECGTIYENNRGGYYWNTLCPTCALKEILLQKIQEHYDRYHNLNNVNFED